MIIDTDPGIDDAMAIFYAVANPAIDILGLTTVFGNVRTSQATRNALFLLEEIGINVPVASGLHKPRVLPPFPPSAAVHGEEGFGSLLEIKPRNSPCAELAPDFLVRMAQENKGEITKKVKDDLINVFIPTTPNPTSGFLLMFPIEDVIYLNMSFEEASKFIVSAGTSNKPS